MQDYLTKLFSFRKMMNLECLPNELLLKIFGYFKSIELLPSFHPLNLRFNQLLFLHFQTCPLDLRSISKTNFDRLCRFHLPSFIDHITSIHLSNEDETPNQPQLFLSYGAFQFIHLQSLSLYQISSTQLINEILLGSPRLIYLNLRTCHFDDDDEQQAEICLNTIWNCQQLQICHLNEMFIPTVTSISSSIEQLSLQNQGLACECFIWIFEHTLALQTLQIQIRDYSDEVTFPLIFSSLTKLNLDFRGTFGNLQILLVNLPNLSKLILQISEIYINGYQWEDLIRRSLPKLMTFRLLMHYQFDSTININEELDQLLQSFQTKFWLDEHRWFIQYHCDTSSRRIHLYTLPYTFSKFSPIPCDISQSTCPIGREYRSFNSVQRLLFNDDLIQLRFQFSKINHLELTLPFDANISSIIPCFDHLISIDIVSIPHSDQFEQSIVQLHQLLDQTIHLYSLNIDYLILSQLSSLRTRNSSIRRLDLMLNDGHFYGLECISLIQSFLGNQCEMLLINFEHRSTILHLIEQMPNLRALICQCQDDQWGESTDSLFPDDELIQWLRMHLPSHSSINRDENEISAIRIWLSSALHF